MPTLKAGLYNVTPMPHVQAGKSSEGEQELSDRILQAAQLLQVDARGSDAASVLSEISSRLTELTQEGGDERMAAGPIVSRSDLNDQQVGSSWAPGCVAT